MSRYYTPPLFIFSIFGGVVTFLIVSGFEENTAVALLFGAITTLVLSITIPAMFAISDRKFALLKKEIKEPIILDERVSYVVGQELKQGFMVTTKESLFVISIDNDKPVKFEIKRKEIKKISISEDVYLNVFLDYDKCIRIFSAQCEDLLKKLHAEGFGK